MRLFNLRSLQLPLAINVLPVSAGVLSGYSSFFPQSKTIQSERGWLLVSICESCDDSSRVCPPSPEGAEIGSSPPPVGGAGAVKSMTPFFFFFLTGLTVVLLS